MKMGCFPYMASENLAADREFYVLQYSMASMTYTQQVLDWKIYFEHKQIRLLLKKMIQFEVG